MDEIPDIINSQIISSIWDVFWTSTSSEAERFSPRNVLVIATPFTAGSAEETQLKKMLQACNLKEDDFNVLQFDTEIAWHLLRDKLQVKTIILLGILPAQLGVSVQLMPHQVSRFNGANWILTGTLQELMQHPDIKSHVWNYGLKPVFIDKVYG